MTDFDIDVQNVLAGFRGRTNTVTIETIADSLKTTKRAVWASIERLRTKHGLPIGSRRDNPGGYFWMVDNADLNITISFYRKQIKTMEENIVRFEKAMGVAA